VEGHIKEARMDLVIQLLLEYIIVIKDDARVKTVLEPVFMVQVLDVDMEIMEMEIMEMEIIELLDMVEMVEIELLEMQIERV